MTAVLIVSLIVLATFAGVLSAKHEGDAPAQGRRAMICSIAYWLFTVIVAFELAAGALWDLLRIEYVRVVLTHLGYPLYLLVILGVWRVPGALTLLVPRFPRLKEWAYAGAFFDYTGAAASHLWAGDGVGQWIGPLIFAGFTLISWGLRPASRRLPEFAPPVPEKRLVIWGVPILTVAAMMVVAIFTLPKGAPPQS
ncbi:MAG TPA: DoxX family protein [Pseudacidobacterium sp.]|nr:DoxX family protein [Pseudacidobacterium sp.]